MTGETVSFRSCIAPTSNKREWRAENPVIFAVCSDVYVERVAPNQRSYQKIMSELK